MTSLHSEFISAATWYGTSQLADELLAAHPELAASDIHTAAILGDDAAVRRFLAADPSRATATCEPYGGNPLTHLCMSKYLRLDPARSDAFVRAATALLDAGADPNGGFWTTGNNPELETPLYGAAGIAHHGPLTRLLLDRGADPNDDEACYHSPEDYNDGGMRALVESGRVNADNLTMMLVRKHDWHDVGGARWLLEHGADPNHWGKREWSPLHHAIRRDNALPMIELLLDHGADATRKKDGASAVELAARRGRGDLLALFEARGIPVELHGADALLGACALHDEPLVQMLAASQPNHVADIVAYGGYCLAMFAGTRNTTGCRLLLDLGVDVNATYSGDGYWDLTPGSNALHVASWKGVESTVKLLLERGAMVNATDAKGRTPLVLAVKACVDSYWTDRRTPESIRTLLLAGANPGDVSVPTGYAEADLLLTGFQEGT